MSPLQLFMLYVVELKILSEKFHSKYLSILSPVCRPSDNKWRFYDVPHHSSELIVKVRHLEGPLLDEVLEEQLQVVNCGRGTFCVTCIINKL